MRHLALSLTVLATAGLLATSTPAQAQPLISATASLASQPVVSEDSGLVAQAATDSERASFLGLWCRTEVSKNCAANLYITQGQNPDELNVRLRSHNGGNEGLIEGTAVMQGAGSYTATMTFDDGKNSANIVGTLTFTMGQRGIEVSYKGDPLVLKLGVGVTVSGVYVKGKPNYIAAVDPLHCFRNTENFQVATQLVGEKNALNMRDMFNNAVVLVDIPGQYQGYVMGTGQELQVKTDLKGHVYILGRRVFANDKNKEMVFYTNDKNMVNRLPAVFEFTGDEREVLVIYKDLKPQQAI